ncbi:MAG: glycosyltransferase family 2 protein [Flavobacteriales bacterium]|nr:glycosyltransferase family 2 protein [Flavobacteriales bacterium]
MSLVSIIMPAKNAGPFIEECLNSILNQTYDDWELIAVNDNSTDDTIEKLQEFSKKDNRITALDNTGNGIIDALKLAYSKCGGTYVTRMDADDIMPPSKLELMVASCEPNTVVTGKVKYIGENLREGYIYYQDWLNKFVDSDNHYSEIYRECVIPSPCWMMDRQSFENIGGFESEIYPEDYDLVFRMYQHSVKVKPIKELLHIWRDHGARASRNDDNYSDNNFLDLKEKYFLNLDHDSEKKLCVLGAGKKGKTMVKKFIEQGLDFIWATDNLNKIGKNIYGKIIANQDVVFDSKESYQVIILVANKDEQEIIKSKLSEKPNLDGFWFC